MDWSTTALMNNSPLARRLPGQRTPPDPTIGQANAADITYGWHSATSSSEGEGNSDSDGETRPAGMTRQEEAAQALRQRRRQLREERRRRMDEDVGSSSEGSIASYNSASAGGPAEPAEESKARETTAPPNPNLSADVDADSFICRICFDGSGSQDEGGETLGRLIAPCRCRGTMKFVHQACLTRWRAASMRQSSIVACDQCGSPYKFRKSKFVGLATNRLLILLVSCLLFVGLIWTVGFTAESVVRRWDEPASLDSQGQAGSKGTKTSNPIWQTVFGENEDGQDQGYDDYEDDVYAYGYGYVSSFYWEPLSYFKLAKAAVKHVASGRATRAVKGLVQGDANPIQEEHEDTPERELGWAEALVDDWKYGSGGIWEGQRPGSARHSKDKAEKQDDLESGTDEVLQPVSTTRERYDAKTAKFLKPGEEPVRKKQSGESPFEHEVQSKTGWWDRITLQFSLGFSLVGIFSFINLLLGVSFWGPFHLGNFGLGRGFARLTGGRRRGGGGGGSDGGTIASVILLFLVIIGILRALMAVISFTTYLSKRLLTRVEDYIVEYSGEEEQSQRENERRAADQDPVIPEAVADAAARWPPRLRRRWWGR